MRYLSPAHIHRLLQFFAVAGMQPLDRFAALFKFLRQGESFQPRARFFCVSAHQHAPWCKHPRGGKPDWAASYFNELQPTVDVVVLVPESPALPRDLVGAGIRTLVNHFLVR